MTTSAEPWVSVEDVAAYLGVARDSVCRWEVEVLMVDRMDQNQEIVTRYLNDPQFQDIAFRLLVKRIYDEIRGGKIEASGGGA